MEVLAKSEDYQITLHRAPSASTGPLVITFGGQDSKLTPMGFGTGWCQRFGWDTIYVAQRHGTQYQCLSIDQFFDAVAEQCNNRDVVCYGSSLGGYCAFYFGGCIDARIVAAAPMLPAWPPLRRLTDAIPLQHVPLIETSKSTRTPIAVFDPKVPHDAMMMADMVMPAYPKTRTVEIPFAGHTVLETLKRSGQVNSFVSAMIERDEVLPVEIDGSENPLWQFEQGKHLKKTDPEQARLYFERSLDLEPSRHVVGNLLSVLLRLRDWSAAQALVDRVQQSTDPRMVIPASNLESARAAGLRL